MTDWSWKLQVKFCPFIIPTLKTRKIRIWKNNKKLLEISSFYTCVSKTTIIWGTAPEIWSETDIIFWHFEPFFSLLLPNRKKFWKNEKASGYVIILHMCTKNHDMMYGDMECNIHCPFTSLLTPKIKIWKNKKNALRYYPFTNTYQKWKSYDARFQRYGTWLMQFLFLILGCFFFILPLWHLKKSKL